LIFASRFERESALASASSSGHLAFLVELEQRLSKVCMPCSLLLRNASLTLLTSPLLDQLGDVRRVEHDLDGRHALPFDARTRRCEMIARRYCERSMNTCCAGRAGTC
jgi:hypothetical protein